MNKLTFAQYQHYQTLFNVDRAAVRQSMAECESLIIEAMSIHLQSHLWHGGLPVYPVMTTAPQNGGWGHLMPFWFKPQERPIPFYALDNWALFALVYSSSFGHSSEAHSLTEQFFTADNVVRVVVGTNLQLPFLPSTNGKGRFFRNGMLPYLLSILWLDADDRRAWLRLHELGAQRFIAAQGLTPDNDPCAALAELEYAIFTRLERNDITSDEAVAQMLNGTNGRISRTPPLLGLYQAMFGAICLGVTAIAAHYEGKGKSLATWREWILPEITMYRLPDYGMKAIEQVVDDTLSGLA